MHPANPQVLTYATLKAMPKPLYTELAIAASYAGRSPQRWAIGRLTEHWQDSYRDLSPKERRAVAMDLLMDETYRLTGRQN